MIPESVREYLRRQPFRPFRIHMSDGSSYEVRHPEMAALTRSTVYVVVDIASDELGERSIECDLYHVTRLELLPGGRLEQSSTGG